ncbi:glycosyltransferase [Candidatus Poribacteria bacterium]|nr:glycosyltransferase [Candidatus Poribacteria bacterium]
MLSGHEILCISTQDWDDLWTRKQRFMTWFARQGNRVIYVEQQMHWLGYAKHFKKQWRRIGLWTKGPRKIEDNLYVYTLPILLPFYQMYSGINGLNYWSITRNLQSQIDSLDFKAPILWTYAPYSEKLVGNVGEKLVVYECVDEFSASKGLVKGNVVKEMEESLLKKSDVVIVTAQSLYDSKKDMAREIRLVPNAAEIEHFRKALNENLPIPEDMAGLKRPIVGFLGSISYWIDIDLIKYIAESRPDWSIVMVGPIRTDVSPVSSMPNVYFTGRKDYKLVPNYLKAFDVCLNPYILDGVAEGCSPLKLYEYLATGKPIVSVDMPEARKFDNVVRIANSREEIIPEIELALQEDERLVKERIDISEKNSWRERFLLENEIIEQAIIKSQSGRN